MSEDKIYKAQYDEDVRKQIQEYDFIEFPDFYMSHMGTLSHRMMNHPAALATGYFQILDLEDKKNRKTVYQSYGDGLISPMTFSFNDKIFEFDSSKMKEISNDDVQNEEWIQKDNNAKVYWWT